MLRISIIPDANAPTIKLEGKLLRPWCDELLRTCREARRSIDLPVRLDLYDVDFVDQDGQALIRALRDDGVTLIRCSNFVAELLQRDHV